MLSFSILSLSSDTYSHAQGNNISNDLIKLQDKLPPFQFKEAERILEEDLEGGIKLNFKEINPKPIAAAACSEAPAFDVIINTTFLKSTVLPLWSVSFPWSIT